MLSREGHQLRRRARRAYAQWSTTLSPRERQQLANVQRIELAIVAVAVDAHNRVECRDAKSDLAEYLVNHELFAVEDRVYHICRRHPAAREVLRRGEIGASFACPAQSPRCPFAAASASMGGAPLQLRVRSATATATLAAAPEMLPA